MSGSWKKVIITISIMLCVGIACTAWNVALDKMTGNIGGDTQQGGYNSDNSQDQYYADNTNAGGTVQGNVDVTGVTGQQATQPNGSAVSNQGSSSSQGGSSSGGSSQQQAASSVLNFSKTQLIAYYNNCLKNSYSQSKMTDTKVEHVDVSVSGIDIGSLNIDVDKFANSIIENNTKNNDKPNTKTFSKGVASDGTAASTFVLPANLYDAAVKTYSVSQSGSGYVVKFVLNSEGPKSYNQSFPYNASCAWPLDINSIDFGSAVTIQSCTFNYPGTVLTANIDSQGRVSSVKVEMPLTVANAQGKALGVTIKVGSISGKWTCTNTMSF